MTPRLDRRRLNRATLARQLLLERSGHEIVDAVEHLVGLQAQAPLAPYVALWSRLDGFDPDAAGAAVQARELVRTHAMRATVHLFSRRDALGIRALCMPMLAARYRSSPIPSLVPGLDVDAVRERTRQVATATPLSRVDLGRRLSETFPGAPPEALAYTATYLEPMVQVPPRGVWGHQGPARWQTFRGFLGEDADHATPVERLVLRYLAAFGPASVPDIRTWSGLSGLREVVGRLAPQLRLFRDDAGRDVYDLPDAPRPDPDTPAPVRFLPEYDNVLLSHADRLRVIPDGRPVPLPPGDGARVGTVLIDGDFRATWRAVRRGGARQLIVTPHARLTRAVAAEVAAEGDRLHAFLGPSPADPEQADRSTIIEPPTG